MRNARFYDLVNGKPVKLTLKPGQTRRYSHFSRHEEGWTHVAYDWRHEGTHVVCDYVSDGADCDGRHSYSCRTACAIDKLAAGFKSDDDYDRGVTYPDWKTLDQYQRDYTAEAAGY